MPEIIIIAAHCKDNLVIGNKGYMPWSNSYPEDLKRFKELTLNHTMIMGRKTFDSVGVLPHRKTYVISKNTTPGIYIKGSNLNKVYEVFNCIESALADLSSTEDKVFIVGGAQVYAQTLHIADRLELTEIHQNMCGDTFFPEYRHLIDFEFKLEKIEIKSNLTYKTYTRI